MAIRVVVGAAVVSTFLSLAPVAHAQAFPSVSQVTATVFDETGAVIPESEIVFKGDSEAIVSRTGEDGSVTVSLPSGRYSVTTTKPGFVKTEIRDVQVPISEALRVVMKVGHTPTDGPIVDVGPILTTSDLPNVIRPERSRVPSASPTKKNRSWQCFYLWRCSSS